MSYNLKIFRNVAVTALIAVVVGLSSCEKYSWEPPRYEPPDTNNYDTIYYSTQLAPLFPQYGCTACHPGLHTPDLRIANSWESLTTLGLIDKGDPPQSKVVINMGPGHGGTFSSDDITLFIDWIYQGALNN